MNKYIVAPLPGESDSLAFADVARVLGIGLVVIQHVGLIGARHAQEAARRTTDHGASFLGTVGVSLLFLLSGYLLGRPYLRAILKRTQLPDTGTFYLKRFLRIYPLYAFALAVIGAVQLANGGAIDGYLAHIFLVHNFSIATAMTIESPMWTMAVDAQFYFVLPILAYVAWLTIGNAPTDRRAGLLAVSLIAMSIASVVIRFAVMRAHPEAASGFDAQVTYLKQLPEMIPPFAIGMLIAIVEMSGRTIRNRKTLIAAGITLPLAYMAFLALSHSHGLGLAIGFAPNDAVSAVAAVAIFCGLRHSRATAFIARAASISYAVYLLHWPIMWFVSAHGSARHALRIAEIVVTIAIVVMPAAWLTHQFIELPFLSMKEQLAIQSSPRPISAPAPAQLPLTA